MKTTILSRKWKNLEREKEEIKKQRLVNKRLATGSLTWRILLGETDYNTETSSGREVLTNGFPLSKKLI